MSSKLKLVPNQPIGLQLTAKERELLLELTMLDDELKSRIQDAPAAEANVMFTLDELARLSKAIPTKAKKPWERKGVKKMAHIPERVAGLLKMFEEIDK
jgi:hypothetical protein